MASTFWPHPAVAGVTVLSVVGPEVVIGQEGYLNAAAGDGSSSRASLRGITRASIHQPSDRFPIRSRILLIPSRRQQTFRQMPSRERTDHRSELCRPGYAEDTGEDSPLQQDGDVGTDHAWPAWVAERPLA
jgi:hypothetical protein